MGNQESESDQRDLGLDWSIDEIVDALSDELEHHLSAAGLAPNSVAERTLIDRVFGEMGEDDASTADWLTNAEHRRLVEEAARRKM